MAAPTLTIVKNYSELPEDQLKEIADEHGTTPEWLLQKEIENKVPEGPSREREAR